MERGQRSPAADVSAPGDAPRPDPKPEDPAIEAARRRRRLWLTALRACMTSVLATFTALAFAVFAWPVPLAVAVAVMTGYVAVESITFIAWTNGTLEAWRTRDGRPWPRSSTRAYADAARVMITTQGVVLGLVAFKDGATLSMTSQIGACSLALGVLVSLVLYVCVAEGPPVTVNQGFAASLFFTAGLWALSFGLVCVVAGTWPT